MNKESVLIYPYDSQFTPLLRHKGFVDNYDKIQLSSLPGWGLCGKDASYADGGEFIGLTVSQEFDEILSEADTVIFAEADNPYHLEKMIYPKIFSAIEAGKNIVTLIQVDEKADEIKKKCERKGVRFTNYRENSLDHTDFLDQMKSEFKKEIVDSRIPILAVIGLAEHTNKFQLQLDLKATIENMGYKVSMVGSRAYCELLGFHSFPAFMKEVISESDKILCYNRYIKRIELTEKPDLIIVAVPGGFMRYNNKIINDFGITAYEIFQAIVPDAVVLSLFHEKYTVDYLDGIIKSVKYKLGLEIDAFNISNRQIDWVEMTNSQPDVISTLTLNPEFMKKSIEECKALSQIPVFNILEKGDAERITNLIIDKLSEIEMAVNF
ncbi:TIGR04066 family peptide maturation system protein [Paenibacillus zanthoxyli]|uniref:TIGR04066 family peptide maturation system protein n=1 Tax=Paenibacillus zanthoxyli TaxID=369399 RepID=UPI000472CA5D|nr:TIGR04066 family peptide maturation system protein [Paenibacillus zanthoxyli]